MIYKEKVQGTQDKVLPLELNIDTVYIRNNIVQKTDEEGRNYWEYNETQLSYQEYVKQVLPQLDEAIAELTELIGEMTNV